MQQFNSDRKVLVRVKHFARNFKEGNLFDRIGK